MKKMFVEPEMVRIELNMFENIAQSEQYTLQYSEIGFPVYTKQYIENCHKIYVNTDPEVPTVGHGYTNTNLLVIAIAGGSCFTNPNDKARAFMMYGIR